MRNRKILLFTKHSILIIILLFMFCIACVNDGNLNNVLDFFTKSELQYETDQQKESIIVALNDILNLDLSEDDLKNKKYPNYTGIENQWDLPTLLNKYFVPTDQNITLGDDFYTKLKRKEVQESIQEILIDMQNEKTINTNTKLSGSQATINSIKLGMIFEEADSLLVKNGAVKNVFSRKFTKPSMSYHLSDNVGLIIIYENKDGNNIIIELLQCNNPEAEKDNRKWENIK